MIKRTLHFGNPAYISKRDKQLVIKLVSEEAERTVPIEDIGVVILDNQQITISHGALMELAGNNVAVITCNETHHPTGLLMPLDGHSQQSERFRAQIDASLPLKKQLWQQTIEAKIYNQHIVLKQRGVHTDNMVHWIKNVKSGDTENHEGRAAAYYWANIFPSEWDFRRERGGAPPNNLLNYGYAILRAIVARALVSSGLLPTLGIHHRNKYNAYCLADDIMEPYRPYVDQVVLGIIDDLFDRDYAKFQADYAQLNPELKRRLLIIPQLDVHLEGETSPLLVGMSRTTASLARCFEGNSRKIIYPTLQWTD
jgi:CRISPR-associated protein Cas1